MEDISIEGLQLGEVETLVEIPTLTAPEEEVTSNASGRAIRSSDKPLINCLRNEKVTVKFVPRQGGLVTDPKHILYGGMGVNSKRRFVVPMLQSGVYKNPLTNSEKEYLEYIMGLPSGSLSIYKKTDNYWANRGVICGKEPFSLDLSNPEDYIKYKILLINKEYVAESEEALKENRWATYQFVLIKEGEEDAMALESLTVSQDAYLLFGQFKDNLRKLALIIEIATGKTIAKVDNQLAVWGSVDKVIKENPKAFAKAAKDPYLDTKLLIRDCIEAGLIRKRGSYYYLTEDNRPLCNEKQEPTLQSACEYLNAPKYQEIKFTLEAKLKN